MESKRAQAATGVKDRLYRLMQGMESNAFDARYRIRTQALLKFADEGADEHGDLNGYVPTPYDLLLRYASRLDLKRDDVFYEIGCGLGRVVCYFARKPIGKCVGIEVSPRLAKSARGNAARVRGRRCPIEIRCEDAAHSDYSDATIIWLFDPFGADTMSAVLDRIGASLIDHPRRIRICYFFPVHAEVLDRRTWLRRTGSERVRWTPFCYVNQHGIAFWENVREPPVVTVQARSASRVEANSVEAKAGGALTP